MSDLGFAGAGGVGRPFTIQDLFSAVTNQTTVTNATTAASVLNQYLDEDDSVSVTDSMTLSLFVPVTYDTGIWQDGVWT